MRTAVMVSGHHLSRLVACLCIGALVALSHWALEAMLIDHSTAGLIGQMMVSAAVGLVAGLAAFWYLSSRPHRSDVEWNRGPQRAGSGRREPEEMRAENRDLRRTADERSMLVSSVAHEIRNPLATVSSFARTLEIRAGDRLSAYERELLQRINDGTDRVNALVGDLLDVSRIDSNNFKICKAEFDLRDAIEDARCLVDHHLRDKSQTLRVDTLLADNLVVADRSRIVQVLTNLASNASKYSPEGSEISIDVEGDADNVVVSVTDRGYGIAPEDQEYLFTPFYRSPQAVRGSEPGTGLGLYIVKSIVEAHGGRTSINSQKDAGTTVTFSIPAHADQ